MSAPFNPSARCPHVGYTLEEPDCRPESYVCSFRLNHKGFAWQHSQGKLSLSQETWCTAAYCPLEGVAVKDPCPLRWPCSYTYLQFLHSQPRRLHWGGGGQLRHCSDPLHLALLPSPFFLLAARPINQQEPFVQGSLRTVTILSLH